jgi:hypothetical protein
MKKSRHDRHCPPFIRLGKELLFKRPEWWDLSHAAKNLYLLLKGKFNGQNNGAIRLSYAEIQRLQIRSLRTHKDIARAFCELEKKGWIRREKKGGLIRFVNEYRLLSEFDCFV